MSERWCMPIEGGGITEKRSFRRREEGSIVLEAALVLPLLLAFVIALAAVMQVAAADAALETAVSETTKQVATHMYPIRLLYDEYRKSDAGRTIGQFVEGIRKARQAAREAETVIDQYAFLIPEPLLNIVQWLAASAGRVDDEAERAWNDALQAAFKPLLLAYADRNSRGEPLLDKERLTVVRVQLPSPDGNGRPYFSIVAEYAVKLKIPFFRKTVHLRKQAVERIWTGSGSAQAGMP